MTGIMLAFAQGVTGDDTLSPKDLEEIIAQEEKNWAEIGNLQGTYFDDPACLIPIEDDKQ